MEQNIIENEDITNINIGTENTSENNSNTGNYCSICIETEPSNTRYIKFPCGHIFHVKCFEEYLDYNISHQPRKQVINCPVCRQTFLTNALKHIFDISHEHPSESITLFIQDDINEEETIQRQCGFSKADTVAICIMLIAITIFLLMLYNI